MASKGDATTSQRGRRGRVNERTAAIAAAGGPLPEIGAPSLGWYADHLEPRTWTEVEDELVHVGDLEALVGAGAITGGGVTLSVQVLPAYAHMALEAAQRSTQGVLFMRLYEAPWDLHRVDGDPVWDHIANRDEPLMGDAEDYG